jgi:VWFA-related protein
MKKYIGVLCLLALALTPLIAQAQAPKPAPVPTPPDAIAPVDDNIVRVTTNLIQIDVVVTDSRGRLITDLKPEDFEILVNEKPQPITAFSLVTLDPQQQTSERSTAANKETRGNIAPAPPVALRATQVKRTIALIVDDLNIDRRNIVQVRSALKKFADEQMQPGDLVAVIRVGSSIGVLQAFTSDKRQIYAAIERIRYNLAQGRGRSLNDLISGEDILDYFPWLKKEDAGVQGNESVRQMLEIGLVTPGLTATNSVIRGMRDLPGRKAVLLLSDGFRLQLRSIRDSVKRIVDTANRSGVVVYTMDTRGLVAEGLTAADLVTTSMTSKQISSAMFSASNNFRASQEGLMYLAEQAGGFAIYNSNDISGGIRRVLDDQNSYYLIGYQPDASLFDPAALRFNQLKIKVKRSGLRVRYRSGFFGIKDQEVRTVRTSPQQKILHALTSPFASDDISLRLTPLFANDPKAGSFMRTLVHVPAKGLVFADKPGNSREAVINIVAYTFGLNGAVVDSVGETHTITLSDKLYDRAQSSGFVYSLNLPVKKAGPYQLRVAVRDDKSDKVGTASQFIVVPDINKNRLILSGIALSSYNPQAQTGRAESVEKRSSGDAAGNILTQATERRFRAGSVLQFAYSIYNATTKDGLPPSLTTQIKLFRDGKELFVGKETPYDAGAQTDMKRLLTEGSLQLGDLDEGEYVLQTIVTDARAKDKNRTTTGWIDFEIVK